MRDQPTGKDDNTNDNFSGGLESYPLKNPISPQYLGSATIEPKGEFEAGSYQTFKWVYTCLLYTSPSPRDLSTSRMPSSA